MKIYLNQNVYDAALERINRIFDEFPDVVVSWSGGKDSTVALRLTLQVAEERGRLPLPALFVDQEAEWFSVIKLTREVMADPRIKPYWLQVPIKISNSTSFTSQWLYCWKEGDEWMRPKEDIAIKENIFGTDRFHAMFTAFFKTMFDGPVANIGGVRCEESPTRTVGLTGAATYKEITWGKVLDKARSQYTFYPLYDWSYTDIWTAIHKNKWPYCSLYDSQYQHGVPIKDMRVSNLHHETAIKNLYYMQEVERETWEKLQQRLQGVSATGMLKEDGMTARNLPFMFKSWGEYRDYLLERLVVDEGKRKIFADCFSSNDVEFADLTKRWRDVLNRNEVNCLLANDFHLTKIINTYNRTNHPFFALRRWRRGSKMNTDQEQRLLNAVDDKAGMLKQRGISA